MPTRLLELEPTSLFGSDAVLTHLTGSEELSRSFDFMLTIASPNEKIKPEQIIGMPLAVRIDRDDEEPRYIHGYVSSFWAGNTFAVENGKDMFRMYRVRIVSWLWFMTRASRCFIYHPEKAEKSIQDVLDAIVKRVKEYGHVEPDLESGNAKILGKRKVEHCVQYRETDFNFLSRTLERYGIFYYFKFANNKHTLILSDQLNYPNAPEAEVKYPNSTNTNSSEDIVTSWEHAYEFVTGKWEQTDYDFIHPSKDLKASAHKHSSITLKNNDAYEQYDYPGEYVKKDDGEAEAMVRLEAEEARFNTVNGTSNCKTFSPGYCFKLTEHVNCKDEKGKSYLITSVSHTATQLGPYTSDNQTASYSNAFTCIPKDSQYRPPRLTPVPLLSSIQTAVVVGPSGEEIYTDEYGRVKVQFHWDREGKKDENTSCWVRVCQVHAGKGFGGIDIPRVGEEVVISFLEGDMARPLVTGRVYHKESMPPFGLPGAKTVSGMKTQTYKGKGHNEMSMNDTPGKEKIHIHAQYDMDTKVLHDHSMTIINNRTIDVTGTHTETVKGATKITISQGTYAHDVAIGTADYKVKGDLTETYLTNQTTKITGNQTTIVGKTISTTSSESEIVMTAKTKISLIVGSSSLVMDSTGKIQLLGTDILIKGSDKVTVDGDKILITGGSEAKMGVSSQNVTCDPSKVSVSGSAINSAAVGMHEITGALVKIN